MRHGHGRVHQTIVAQRRAQYRDRVRDQQCIDHQARVVHHVVAKKDRQQLEQQPEDEQQGP